MGKTKTNIQQCPMCGGRKEKGKSTFSADLGNNVLMVRNVPALVCAQCGEEWIENNTASALQKLVEGAKDKKHQFEVVTF